MKFHHRDAEDTEKDESQMDAEIYTQTGRPPSFGWLSLGEFSQLAGALIDLPPMGSSDRISGSKKPLVADLGSTVTEALSLSA
jgi:hypothetical protein